MKKVLLPLIFLSLILGCTKTPYEPEIKVVVPNPLEIKNRVGIKLETQFVKDEVNMNVKLETSESVTIKIIDIGNRVVSKEVYNAKSGDNIIKVYTNTLPPSAYRVGLYNKDGILLGITDFNKL